MDLPLLSRLTPGDRETVLAAFTRRAYDGNVYVFHEGDPGHTLHLIESGRVSVRATTPQGDVAMLAVLGPGDPFGELSVVADEPHLRSAACITLEPTRTLSIDHDAFARLRDEHPAFDRFLVEVLAGQVRKLTSQVIEALYVPVKKRVLRRLVALADIYSDAGGVIPLSQDDIAAMAGTSRPTANKILREAESKGMIEIGRRRITVGARDALEAAAR